MEQPTFSSNPEPVAATFDLKVAKEWVKKDSEVRNYIKVQVIDK